MISESPNAKNIIYPVLQGKNLTRYCGNFNNQYLIYTTSETHLEDYPSVHNYLLENKPILDAKLEVQQGKMVWYSLYRPALKHFSEFLKEKIVFSKASKEQSFYLDRDLRAIGLNTCYIATGENIKPLLAILNSKFIRYCFLNFYQSGGINGEITMQAIEQIPIPTLEKNKAESFEKLALNMTVTFEEKIRSKAKFIKYLQSQFSLETLSKKLQNWHELDFGDFIIELNKAIKKVGTSTGSVSELSKLQEMDWMEVFETKKAEAQTLKTQIDNTDQEIDQMVYELYGLTEEEIKIVEGSV